MPPALSDVGLLPPVGRRTAVQAGAESTKRLPAGPPSRAHSSMLHAVWGPAERTPRVGLGVQRIHRAIVSWGGLGTRPMRGRAR